MLLINNENLQLLIFPVGIYLGKVCLNSGGWWIAKKEDNILYWSWIRKHND